jgi:hypothetical protein
VNFETTPEIEWAVAVFFHPHNNIVVPNVTWGMDLGYEADLLVMTPAGYLYEVEIKISKSDLKADRKKYHHHDGEKIRKLWFAFPEKLCRAECFELVPDGAGILSVNSTGWTKEIQKAVIRKHASTTAIDRDRFLYLGYVRLWHLKRTIIELRKKINTMKAYQ